MQEMIETGFTQTAREARRIVDTLLDCEKPVVAKLNGDAIGLGVTIALFCDVIFMAEGARVGDPHVRAGLTSGDGGAIIWPQLSGYARAKEYLLTGDLLLAAEAARNGLINHVVAGSELDARVAAFADRFASGSALAIRTTKASIIIALKQAAASALDASLAFETQCSASPDHREAVAAFREGRRPKFAGGLI
jgi:enoyl-CoA hydratase